jgi:hypothetical protein
MATKCAALLTQVVRVLSQSCSCLSLSHKKSIRDIMPATVLLLYFDQPLTNFLYFIVLLVAHVLVPTIT